METPTELTCTCGRFRCEVTRAPIIAAECHCTSCRAAATQLRARPGAPAFQEADGSTRFVLYRKDRVRFVAGEDTLRELRLTPQSKTRRIVASCCNSPVGIEFAGGHWVSLFASLWPAATRPAPALRTRTQDRDDGAVLSDDIPGGALATTKFFAKLLGAWVAMGFRAPSIGKYAPLPD